MGSRKNSRQRGSFETLEARMLLDADGPGALAVVQNAPEQELAVFGGETGVRIDAVSHGRQGGRIRLNAERDAVL